MIYTFGYLSVALLILLIVIGMINLWSGDTNRAGSLRDGQCEQMQWFLATHELRPEAEVRTKQVYIQECK